jgi:hypothetical protein
VGPSVVWMLTAPGILAPHRRGAGSDPTSSALSSPGVSLRAGSVGERQL